MTRTKGLMKHTLTFMGIFIGLTIGFIILWAVVLSFVPTGTSIIAYVPQSSVVDPKALDWKAISAIGGYGAVLDEDGEVKETFGEWEGKKSYTTYDLLDGFNRGESKETTFVYDTQEGYKFLLFYPQEVFELTPTMNIDTVMGDETNRFLLVLFAGLVLYLILVFVLIKRLSRKLKEQLIALGKEEEAKKMTFLRGLAHDIKTPLSTMISYAKALEDRVVLEGDVAEYYRSIVRNGQLLNERVEDMMSLMTLGDEGLFRPERGDLLEGVRRYAGEHYSWYGEKGATITFLYADDASYVTVYDPKLLERMLQNLLQNSVHHNPKPVHISIGWDPKKRCLTIGDDGGGIPQSLHDTMWDPMVTGDASRTGDGLRGMGLANVRRIVESHGWEIQYDNGFQITIP